ncbi:MAG: hypothetical protein VXY56_03715, partial [Pseudomonadota bacterium]|nr:hypothetical protein [Pseudomonadota bacterium]
MFAKQVQLEPEASVINMKDLYIKPIETAIANHTSDHFIINQNYEIVIPKSGKSLLHPNYFDNNTLGRLFEKL